MIKRDLFFGGMRDDLFPNGFIQEQVKNIDVILDEWERREWQDLRWLAYIFATTYHETNVTMAPVREAYWLTEDWRERNLRYYPWYGRGYVQLTWEDNYRKMKELIGVDLIKDPDLAMVPVNACVIMFEGMVRGTFTTQKLETYFNDITDDPVGARKIINGTDKNVLIAGYHQQFLHDLQNAS